MLSKRIVDLLNLCIVFAAQPHKSLPSTGRGVLWVPCSSPFAHVRAVCLLAVLILYFTTDIVTPGCARNKIACRAGLFAHPGLPVGNP